MKQLSTEDVKNMYLFVAEHMIQYKDLLCNIDGEIGDGDHGFGIERGFKSIKEKLESNNYETINEVFKGIGMSMLQSMGGASGVIFSGMFLGGSVLPKLVILDSEALALIMGEGLKKVKALGNAEIGDKTMVDAFEPAVLALEENQSNSIKVALENACLSANEGVENTKKFKAKFGRAKFVQERSIGVQDAGATTVSLIFKLMYEFVLEKEGNYRV